MNCMSDTLSEIATTMQFSIITIFIINAKCQVNKSWFVT